jgi:hypothetical protein
MVNCRNDSYKGERVRHPPAFKGAAKLLADTAKNGLLGLFNPDCAKDLQALGLSPSQVAYGATQANFLNGVGSSVPLSSLFADSPAPYIARNAHLYQGTVGDAMVTHGNLGTVAMSQLGGHDVYLNSALIDPNNAGANLGTVFHEVTHNLTGLTDNDIQRFQHFE